MQNFQKLKAIALSATRKYLNQFLGAAGVNLVSAMSPEHIFMWATVHANGTAHARHVHKNAMVSGVFYAKTGGAHSGKITFDDPRGPLPPFGEPF